jgi:serine/threonine protein kinase
VDVRADLYGLGATGYFLLTGKPPFSGATVAQKLIAAQTSEARACHLVNPTVPVELSVVITKLLAKKASDRYQTPEELLAVLDRWAETPPDPPSDAEFPNRDGSSSAPLPTSAVALSFNLMKAARGGSGNTGGSSGQLLNKPATSSSLRLHADVATTPQPPASESPTAENRKGETKVNHAVTETPTPGVVATPAPAAVSPLKTVAPRVRETKPVVAPKPKMPRKPPATPPPIPVMGMSANHAKLNEPAPLVDMVALRERATKEAAALTAEQQKPKPKSGGGFWGFLKSLFGGKRRDAVGPAIRDSSVLG